MRYIFLTIFCVVFALANCDINSVASLERMGAKIDINKPIIGANLSQTYTLKAGPLASSTQLAIAIEARFDTLVSVNFTQATAANFVYKISNTAQNNQLLCNQQTKISQHKSQDIKLKNGEYLLIIFGSALASEYEFKANIVLKHMINSQTQNTLEAQFNNIYTQIIGREFELDFSVSQSVSDLEILLNDSLEIYKSTTFNGEKIRSVIPNLASLNYKNLYFIAKFKNQKGEKKEIKSPNFTARPAGFRLENIPKNLKGGAKYTNFRLIALDDNGIKISGYNGHFSGDFITHTLQSCEANIVNEMIEFRDGVGVITTHTDYFIYPEIGLARIKFIDSQNIDKIRNGCILNSATNIPDSQGKIGCNAEIIQDIGEFALDKIVHVGSEFSSQFGLFGTIDENLSKIQYDNFMGVKTNLIFEARLEDGSVAKLFSAGCYAFDVSFANTSALIMHAIDRPASKNLIYQSGKNIYTIGFESFKNGIGVAEIKLSMPRKNPQNPLKIEPNQIDTNLTNQRNVTQNILNSINPLSNLQTSAYLYYAKAYGQKLIQTKSYPVVAKIYLAIYCDSVCQKIAKTSNEYSVVLDENMSEVSELKDYFIFKDFNTTANLIEFKTMQNYARNITNGVMDVVVNGDEQIEFEIKNTHFKGSDFVWVRPFNAGLWVGSGDQGEVLGIKNNQNIRYNHTIEW